jgi:hypothetical protein
VHHSDDARTAGGGKRGAMWPRLAFHTYPYVAVRRWALALKRSPCVAILEPGIRLKAVGEICNAQVSEVRITAK